MNAEEIKEEIQHQRILQKECRNRLRALEVSRASFDAMQRVLSDDSASKWIIMGIV